MGLRRGINLFSLTSCSLWALLCLLLCVGFSPTKAQTNTPQPSPIYPSATAPVPANPGASTTHYDFSHTQAFFGFYTEGTYVVGEGFETVDGRLIILGQFTMESVVGVRLFYTSEAATTFDFSIEDTITTPVFSGGGVLDSCPASICAELVDVSQISGDTMRIDFTTADGVFTLRAMDVIYGTDNGGYIVEDGCPVLSPEQIEKLEPRYFAECSRCFLQPTPVRDNPIFTPPFTPQLTVNPATFQIPVIISGTPKTPTPFGTAAPVPTFAPGTPTLTPTASSTPVLEVITFDFTGSNERGWVSPTLWGGMDNDVTELGWESVWTTISNQREYFQLNYTGAPISGVTALAVTFTSPFDHYDVEFYDTDGTNVGVAYASRGGTPTGAMQTEIFTSLPGGTVTLDGWAFNAFSNQYISDPSGSWYIHKIEVLTNNLVTVTPTYTPSVTPTGVPWVQLMTATPSDCSIAQWRDDRPIASFPDKLSVVTYQCYTLIPEIVRTTPEGEFGIDGFEVCVLFFEFPVVQILGFTIYFDWILIGVMGWLIIQLLRF